MLAGVIQSHPNRTGLDLGENLFVVLLVMAPSSQELAPPANPGRFTPEMRHLWRTHSMMRIGSIDGIPNGPSCELHPMAIPPRFAALQIYSSNSAIWRLLPQQSRAGQPAAGIDVDRIGYTELRIARALLTADFAARLVPRRPTFDWLHRAASGNYSSACRCNSQR